MVRIRDYIDSDLKTLAAIRNDIKLQKQLKVADPKPQSTEEVVSWIKRRSTEENSIFKTIADIKNDHCLGFMQLVDIDKTNMYGYLGIAIASKWQGEGYGGLAIKLFCGQLVNKGSIKKVMLSVLETNIRAIDLYKKLGFEQCGLYKKHFLQDGIRKNVLIMEKMLEDY